MTATVCANKVLGGLGQRSFIGSLLQLLRNDDNQDIDSLNGDVLNASGCNIWRGT